MTGARHMTFGLIAWYSREIGELREIDFRDLNLPGANSHLLGYRGEVVKRFEVPLLEESEKGRVAARAIALGMVRAEVLQNPALARIRQILAERFFGKPNDAVKVETVEEDEWQTIRANAL